MFPRLPVRRKVTSLSERGVKTSCSKGLVLSERGVKKSCSAGSQWEEKNLARDSLKS